MVTRRLPFFVLFTLLLGLSGCYKDQYKPLKQQWEGYTEAFYRDGRIIDTRNLDISHTESQGYGMLLAAAISDKQRFEHIWQWTQQTLQREDHLFSWRYVPCASQNKQCVDDPNNASDGDILIAWALLRAHKKWPNHGYDTEALQILSSIKQKLIKQAYGYTLLLPGEIGFESPEKIEINLSYWVFPALATFYDVTGDKVWTDLSRSGYQLIGKARFGHWQLPPDWISINETGLSLTQSPLLNQEYGFNAVRIPLHLVWQPKFDATLLTPFLAFWQQSPFPATVNLNDDTVSDYPATIGMKSIALTTQMRLGKRIPTPFPQLAHGMDYYSASLMLLSSLAVLDQQK